LSYIFFSIISDILYESVNAGYISQQYYKDYLRL
jgi:hypothetical protein